MAGRPWAMAELTWCRPFVDKGRLVVIRRKLLRDRVPLRKCPTNSDVIHYAFDGAGFSISRLEVTNDENSLKRDELEQPLSVRGVL